MTKKNEPNMRRGIQDFSKNNDADDTNNSNNPSASGQMNIQAMVNQPNPNQPSNNDDDVPEILINYNEAAFNGDFTEAFFRDRQIRQTVSILTTRKKPNALIKGDAGVGKTQLVEEIARRIVNDDPIITHEKLLKDKIIYELPLSSIVSGSSLLGQLEQKIENVITFAQNPDNNAIIFIDEIHLIMAGKSNPSYDTIAQILKPAIHRGEMHLIGATTTQEATTLMNDTAFKRRFGEVLVPELSIENTEEIIFNIRADYQSHHNVSLNDDLVEKLVSISDEHKLYGTHRPDTSITLLDTAMADAQLRHVENLEKAKTDPTMDMFVKMYPIPSITEQQLKESALTLLTGDKSMFNRNINDLQSSLDNNIIGQPVAKEKIVDAVRRLGLGLTKRVRPTSFLFAGQTGTGKSEIAKLMAQAIFGSKDRMISINLSEYSQASSLTRITGSSDGYVGSDSKRQLPFDTLETNPYQLILLDEFEKADPSVQQFFMQALEEGEVKSNRNTIIDFRRTIIVATTNAGVVELSKPDLGFKTPDEEDAPQHTANDIINILKDNIAVEILNRFENVTPFTSISEEQYIQIIAVKYNQLIKEIQDNRRDLILSPDHINLDDALSNDILIKLAKESYSQARNGRPAEYTIRTYIEDTIINDTNATQFDLL